MISDYTEENFTTFPALTATYNDVRGKILSFSSHAENQHLKEESRL